MLKIIHAMKDRTGGGLALDVAYHEGDDGADLLVSFLRQEGETVTDEDAWTATLGVLQATHLVDLARGREKCILSGRGVFCRSRDGSLDFRLYGDAVAADGKTVSSYRLDLRAWRGGEKVGRRRLYLSPAEMNAVALAVESAIGAVAFGL